MCLRSRVVFFFQAEDGIRDLVRSRGLGDVYKRQGAGRQPHGEAPERAGPGVCVHRPRPVGGAAHFGPCLLYTSDAADERSSVDLGGRRIIKKKKKDINRGRKSVTEKYTNVESQQIKR